jgi:hypothetical protein
MKEIARTIVRTYKFDNLDDTYTNVQIKNMSIDEFKMFVSFLEPEEFDRVYNIVNTDYLKSTLMQHVFNSLKF